MSGILVGRVDASEPERVRRAAGAIGPSHPSLFRACRASGEAPKTNHAS